ncbi:ankyrin [Plakobranchus ocellatus]|uniref:Ankyrin n=1 Tax=Plakobranchus ocellatus TaxID=259542 RepID=A0AAV3YCA4_9GAST|nr:ankyrin [Plakobranchus ocellatus]
MYFHRLAPRDPSVRIIAALRNGHLHEINHLLDVMDPINSIPGEDLPEAYKADLKSCVVKWINSTTNLDPKTCQTLLRPAIISGSIETVEAFLNRGAKLNLPCSCSKSVLVVALTFLKTPDLMKMVRFLAEKGANVNRSFGDYSPLLVASLKRPDIVPCLLQNGADVNEVGDLEGNTSLTAALCNYRSSTHCRSIVETLLSASADPNKTNNRGQAALHLSPDTEIASLLIQAGADLEARDGRGKTPLLTAADRHRTDIINVLYHYGADMAAVDNEGNSALHMMVKASDEPQEETLRLFASQCNQINKKGMTPLMLAAQRRHTQAVKIFLELGADPNIVTYEFGEPHTALSFMLDDDDRKFHNLFLACAEELITHNSVTSLPRCCRYFLNMIERDQRRLVQLMVTHGMAPLCENTRTIDLTSYISSVRLCDIPGKLSPLAVALESNKLAIAQYLTENWFLTPADLIGSMELRHLRSKLEIVSRADGLRFMDENLSQPMSLKKLSFVVVSAQLGGVAGREERVSQTPLPNILKDKLLFRHENFPMDFTDWRPLSPFDDEDDEFEHSSDDYYSSDQTVESDRDC